jgi:hypothetical protein
MWPEALKSSVVYTHVELDQLRPQVNRILPALSAKWPLDDSSPGLFEAIQTPAVKLKGSYRRNRRAR